MSALSAVFVLVAAASAVSSDSDIQVYCRKDSILILWQVGEDLAENPSRLFLGSCMASNFTRLSDGGGLASFHYLLDDCSSKPLITRDEGIYTNQLTFRPQAKPHPPAVTKQVKCTYKRFGGWSPFLKPAGDIRGHGGLDFAMAILNEELNGVATSNIFPLGSFIPLWAAVAQQLHQPLLLLLEECVASTTPDLMPESKTYPIITNKGCLVDSLVSHSRLLQRSHSSSLLLYLQAFKFSPGQDVYIHCKLVAWDPHGLSESKKACNYSRELGGWQLLDDPLRNDLCNCCASSCHRRTKRGLNLEPQGLVLNSVVGPLIITEEVSTHE